MATIDHGSQHPPSSTLSDTHTSLWDPDGPLAILGVSVVLESSQDHSLFLGHLNLRSNRVQSDCSQRWDLGFQLRPRMSLKCPNILLVLGELRHAPVRSCSLPGGGPLGSPHSSRASLFTLSHFGVSTNVLWWLANETLSVKYAYRKVKIGGVISK